MMKANSMAECYIDFNKVWQRHIDLYAEVFIYSLKRLSKDNCLKGQEEEDWISVHLWKNLKKTCKEWIENHNEEIKIPVFQMPIQDIERARICGANSLNKPDFTCSCYDALKGEDIGLHVECKRLGIPSSPSWKLNKNYITHGIVRFDSKEHKYGMNAISGMMIGYIVSMLPKDILKEVNKFQNEFLNEYPKIEFNFRSGFVFKTQQKITRKNIRPKNFKLIHLWIDLKQSNN